MGPRAIVSNTPRCDAAFKVYGDDWQDAYSRVGALALALEHELAAAIDSRKTYMDMCEDYSKRLSHSQFQWVPVSERMPATEDRYFIVYRHSGSAGIEKPHIGDYIYDRGEWRWSGLPRDCSVIYWALVPDWESPK